MDSEIKPAPTIFRRRCRRYFPADADEQLFEFLRDRYRHSAVGSIPCGPFCRCGLLRDEHLPDALANAPPDLDRRERFLRERTLGAASRRSRLARSRTLAHRGVRQTSASLSPPPDRLLSVSPFRDAADGEAVPDWDPVRDTVEEPTDVNFDAPIALDKNSERASGASTNAGFEHYAPGRTHNRVCHREKAALCA